MTWRRAGAYCALFIGLAIYYVATEPRTGADAPAVAVRRAFVAASSSDVHSVTVEQADARVHCVRDGERWRVEEPATARVPSDLVGALVDQLTALSDVEVVNETGQGAAQFGLDPPVARVTLGLADGRKIGVALGARNPGQTAAYARVDGAPRILLVGLNVLYYGDLIVQASGRGAG